MAYNTTIVCTECKQTKHVIVDMHQSPPTVCGDCIELAYQKKKKEFLEGRNALTVEQRLRAIEAVLYDLQNRR